MGETPNGVGNGGGANTANVVAGNDPIKFKRLDKRRFKLGRTVTVRHIIPRCHRHIWYKGHKAPKTRDCDLCNLIHEYMTILVNLGRQGPPRVKLRSDAGKKRAPYNFKNKDKGETE